MKKKKQKREVKKVIVQSNVVINDKHLMEIVTKSMGKINLRIEDMIIRECSKKVNMIINKPEFLEWIKSEAVTASLISQVYNRDEETERKRIIDAIYDILNASGRI